MITFDEWRASIPFSNEQIAAALDRAAAESATHAPKTAAKYQALAARLRETGRPWAQLVRAALPYLVTKCAVCGKKALYRIEALGACSAHRDALRPLALRIRAAMDRNLGDYQAAMRDRERERRSGERHHDARGRKTLRRA